MRERAGGMVIVYPSTNSEFAESADTTRVHGLSPTLNPARDNSVVPCLLTSRAHRPIRCTSSVQEKGVTALRTPRVPWLVRKILTNAGVVERGLCVRT